MWRTPISTTTWYHFVADFKQEFAMQLKSFYLRENLNKNYVLCSTGKDAGRRKSYNFCLA